MADETAAEIGADLTPADERPIIEGSEAMPLERRRGTRRAGSAARAAPRGDGEPADTPPRPRTRRRPTAREDPPLLRPVPPPVEDDDPPETAAVGRVAASDVDPDWQPQEPDGDELGWGGHDWLDQDAGPVVRPYTVTGGRARSTAGSLDLLSYVEALYAPEADLVDLQPEHRSILQMTRTALSVAEIAAHLDLPVGVVRVLVGDLVQAHLVSTFSSGTAVHPPDESILQAVIDGLRAL